MNSGVYEIVNLENGKRYVGSAVRFTKRWAEHRRDLKRGRHHCVALQRAWNKYGESAFAFRVLTECGADDLIALEQDAMDRLMPEYNICRVAGSSLGLKHSEETRRKMSAALMGNTRTRGHKYSREICERMAAPKRGKKRAPFTQEHKQRISIAKRGNKGCVGRILSDETKEKLRVANLGKKKSVQQRLKLCILTDDQVRSIRKMRNDGYSYRQIAELSGVRQHLVRKVCIKERYEWIDPDIEVRSFRRKGWKVIGRKRKAA